MRVAIYAFEGVSMFHLSAPQIVFGEIARLGLAPGWSTVLWSQSGGSVRTSERYVLDAISGPQATKDADIVIVPSWPFDTPPIDSHLRDILLRAHRRGAVIAGLCLGAIAVADTGILDGRSAVTHWEYMPLLAQRRPEVMLDKSVLYIDHGDVLTSAGTVASIDACLHLVRRYLGASVATRVARGLVVAPHREGGQAQYVEHPIAIEGSEDRITEVCQWALTRLNDPLSIDQLAKHACMSRRSFVRKFAESTGTTPAKWIVAQRLEQARVLLEETDWDMDRIAHASGFNSTVTFRQNFLAQYSTKPSTYRRNFAGATGSDNPRQSAPTALTQNLSTNMVV